MNDEDDTGCVNRGGRRGGGEGCGGERSEEDEVDGEGVGYGDNGGGGGIEEDMVRKLLQLDEKLPSVDGGEAVLATLRRLRRERDEAHQVCHYQEARILAKSDHEVRRCSVVVHFDK